MLSKDYVDAFEKLLRLGLKDAQEREVIHVMVDCCLQVQLDSLLQIGRTVSSPVSPIGEDVQPVLCLRRTEVL